MLKILSKYCISFLSLCTIFLPIFSSAQEPLKQEIQAAMIIKFTDFIEWPPHSFEEDSNGFTIAILGKNEYQELFKPFEGRLFHGRELKIINYLDIEKIYTDKQDIGKIQILIFSQSENKIAESLIEKIKLRPILTVGDFPGFAQNGGIINFFQKANNRIGFEINMEAKDLANIKISSHLLKLGKIVGKEKNRGWLKDKKDKP
ncbi:MAG: YfiR family protein [Desulfamplus sp.]|nr:YfiR family protein [Desulfamplus sp.]